MSDDMTLKRQLSRDWFKQILGTTELGEQLEATVFNFILSKTPEHERYWQNNEFRKQYFAKVLQMKFNLSDSRNPALLQKVVNQTLPLSRLVAMHPYELFPENWTDVFDRIAKKQLKKQIVYDDPMEAPDSLFTCQRCRKRKITFHLLQTRSADEPMTAFCYCLICRVHFKTSG
jgi:transcription elongation factor S-II